MQPTTLSTPDTYTNIPSTQVFMNARTSTHTCTMLTNRERGARGRWHRKERERGDGRGRRREMEREKEGKAGHLHKYYNTHTDTHTHTPHTHTHTHTTHHTHTHTHTHTTHTHTHHTPHTTHHTHTHHTPHTHTHTHTHTHVPDTVHRQASLAQWYVNPRRHLYSLRMSANAGKSRPPKGRPGSLYLHKLIGRLIGNKYCRQGRLANLIFAPTILFTQPT